MAKILVLLLVVVIVVWLVLGRRGTPPDEPPRGGPAKKPGAKSGPQALLACAHCGVQLPRAEAQFDAAGRPFCSEAHRLAGPR